mmetsp:Transcript_21091/g.52294  ORF Transcript_21091/g.52294 Transcript_21091/m.52294 type:complete len:851 (-) Transcript_21091:2325-4877(-)
MDPRGSSEAEAAEGVTADFAAASRSRRVKNLAQTVSNMPRRGGCRCCQGPCRNVGRERAISESSIGGNNDNGTGAAGGKTNINVRDNKQHLHPNKDSFFEDDNVNIDYNEQWDGQGKDHNQDKHEGGRLIRRGNEDPKFIDAPTPTLIDEDEFYEDEEMVKLEYERIRRNATAPIGSHSRRTNTAHSQNDYVCMSANGDEAVRRTPGAQMYRSTYDNTNQGTPGGDSKQRSERTNSFDKDNMRRTPGPSKMHASVLPIAVQSPTKLSQDRKTADSLHTDSSGLGFGLTLSSPIAPGEKRPDETRSLRVLSDKDPSSNRSRLGGDGRGVYSPNTLRLAEDMDNLLLEDDDNFDESQKISQFVFRSGQSSGDKNRDSSIISRASESVQQDNRSSGISESWTTHFIVNMEQNQHQNTSRVPRNTHGRGRKSRLERERSGRSRGGIDRIPSSSLSSFSSSSTTWGQQRPGGNSFLPHAHQPTPVRSVQPQSFGGFNGGDRNANAGNTFYHSAAQDASFVRSMSGRDSSFVDYLGQQHGHGDMTAPALNFGGAFSPPGKVTGNAPSRTTQQPQQQRSFAPPPITGSFFGSSDHGNSGFDAPLQFPPFLTGTPTFGASFSNQAQRHQAPTPPPYFHGSPVFGHSATFQNVVPHFGDSGQHPHSQLHPNNPRPIRHSPTFNFPLHPNPAYQMNAPTHHPPTHHSTPLPQDFMVNVSVPHAQSQPNQQQPTQFIPNPQSWPSNTPGQYEAMHPPSSLEQQFSSHTPAAYPPNHGGWQMQQYGMHPLQPQVLRESQTGPPNVGTSTRTWNHPDSDQQLVRLDGSQQGSHANVGSVLHRPSFPQPKALQHGRPSKISTES